MSRDFTVELVPAETCDDISSIELTTRRNLFLVTQREGLEQSIAKVIPPCRYKYRFEFANKALARQCQELTENFRESPTCYAPEVLGLTVERIPFDEPLPSSRRPTCYEKAQGQHPNFGHKTLQKLEKACQARRRLE